MKVFVAAIRNRNVPIPEMSEELHEIHDKEAGLQTEVIQRTDQFRYRKIDIKFLYLELSVHQKS